MSHPSNRGQLSAFCWLWSAAEVRMTRTKIFPGFHQRQDSYWQAGSAGLFQAATNSSVRSGILSPDNYDPKA
jgi:hypothetical protein